MGSTSGALISQLQFNLKLHNQRCFERLGNIKSHLNSVQSHHPRGSILRLLTRRDSRSFVCFAVDDDLKEKQIELGGGSGSGSAVEERPDVAASSREEKLGDLDQDKQIYNFLYPSKELLPDDKEK